MPPQELLIQSLRFIIEKNDDISIISRKWRLVYKHLMNTDYLEKLLILAAKNESYLLAKKQKELYETELLYIAAEQDNPEIIKDLLPLYPETFLNSSLYVLIYNRASNTGSINVLKYIDKLNIFNKSRYDDIKGYALLTCVNFSKFAAIQYLIEEAGANINFRIGSIIETACSVGNIEIIDYLFKKEVNIEYISTITIYNLCMRGKLEVIKYLCENGFYLKGNSLCIRNAKINGHSELVNFLSE